jgi:hypothetical protein
MKLRPEVPAYKGSIGRLETAERKNLKQQEERG